LEYFLKKPERFQEVLRKVCMNKYEEKFKKVIAAKVTSLESKEIALKQVEKHIAFVEELLKNLQDDKEVFFGIKSEVIEFWKKRLEKLPNIRCIYKDEIARIRKELIILQSVCPHEDTTFDHKDYHKNEDYYKCNTCGMIV
jgi:phosphoglycerate-specific signal transduction histidine kinase